MGGPAGMRNTQSMGLDVSALNPGLFDADDRSVPLLTRPKANRKAVHKKGGGQASRGLASTPVLNLMRFKVVSRYTRAILHAAIHKRLHAQASFTVSRAVLCKPTPDRVSSADLKLKYGGWRNQDPFPADSSVDKNVRQLIQIPPSAGLVSTGYSIGRWLT